MAHLHTNGWAFLDDSSVTLAQLLAAPGETLGFCYDIGDHWHHSITLEALLPEGPQWGGGDALRAGGDAQRSGGDAGGRADGAAMLGCEVLEGAMACPPEDSLGMRDLGIPGMGNGPYNVRPESSGPSQPEQDALCPCSSCSAVNALVFCMQECVSSRESLTYTHMKPSPAELLRNMRQTARTEYIDVLCC